MFVIILTASGCVEKELKPKGTPEYIAEIEQWHQERIERLKDENSWLTLVGLHWLKEGENSFGSDKDNDIVFPANAPQNIGKIVLNDSVIKLRVNEGVNVINEGKLINQL